MTTPTQAQIEAEDYEKAEAVLAPYDWDYMQHQKLRVAIATTIAEERALTAVAQVDRETAMLQWLRRNATAEKEPKAKAAFIEAHNACLQIKNEHTAAQVGEQDLWSQSAKEWHDTIETATIERCASVAETFLKGPLGQQVATVIRGLKDEA